MKIVNLYLLLSISLMSLNCKGAQPDVIPEAPANIATPTYNSVAISTDKATYKPGDEVIFTIENSTLPNSTKVRYKYQNTILSESVITAETWKWQTPTDDFRGYIAEVYSTTNNIETIYAAIAVDVSSDWTKFPRYGFLSEFGQLSDQEISSVIKNLNRHHINGLQFYDWLGKHHQPLPMTGAVPANSWKDIINRDIYFNTVEKYIASAHSYNMKAMFYNLIYGAWENAEADGVQKEWYVYNDNTHSNRDFHPLGAPFLSNIYLLDPSNTGWQQYAITETKKVYQFLDFDGFHMDQLGDRGTRYTYSGTFLNLGKTYKPFIDAIKNAAPEKYNIMNAVAQYGQQDIGSSKSDIMYSEVWSPSDNYNDLANIIKQNNVMSNNTKNTVLAAYMNYDKANSVGYFNTPSVLMTNAVIFAFGGAHLELGEHMLGKEYFPNSNLTMKDDLKKALLNYYDFLVAYQNLLREGGAFNSVTLASTDAKIKIQTWPATSGYVSVFGKKFDNKQVIHLINFTNSTSQQWRDNSGIQVMPALVKEAKLLLTTDEKVKKMWIASPDFVGGASRTLNFAQIGNKVSFILPELRYWDMIVVEY